MHTARWRGRLALAALALGLAAAPADAADDVRGRVHWIAKARGGAGAARELIELILRAQGLWESVLATYLAASQGQPT